MCYIDTHECFCDHHNDSWVLLVRKIVCAPSMPCRSRDDPPERDIIRCENFHLDLGGTGHWRCAICRRARVPPNPDPEGDQAELENQFNTDQRRAFVLLDRDRLPECHHRDPKNKYVTHVYQTGKVFAMKINGGLTPVRHGNGRKLHYQEN